MTWLQVGASDRDSDGLLRPGETLDHLIGARLRQALVSVFSQERIRAWTFQEPPLLRTPLLGDSVNDPVPTWCDAGPPGSPSLPPFACHHPLGPPNLPDGEGTIAAARDAAYRRGETW